MAVLHIAWRELRSAWTTPVAWLMLSAWLVLAGLFWYAGVNNYVLQSQNLLFDPYAASMLTLKDYLITPWFGNMLVVQIIVCPALAMGLFTREYSQRTMELLLTSPVHTWQVVLGKYLGAMGLGALLMLGTFYVPATVYWYATPDWGPFIGGYLALLLVQSVLISVGMVCSAFSRSQVLAFIWGLAVTLGLYIVSWLSDDPTSMLAQVSISGHLEDIFMGSLRLSDLTYFASFTVLMLFVTQQRLESFRWA